MPLVFNFGTGYLESFIQECNAQPIQNNMEVVSNHLCLTTLVKVVTKSKNMH